MIKITDKLSINEDDIDVRFIRSSGPGGQHVNKVESAVQIRFDAKTSDVIGRELFARLKKLASQKMTDNGVIVITAETTRSQTRNKEEAITRLIDLIKQATIVPKKRKNTKPSFAAKQKRLESKKKRGVIKKLRNKQVE